MRRESLVGVHTVYLILEVIVLVHGLGWVGNVVDEAAITLHEPLVVQVVAVACVCFTCLQITYVNGRSPEPQHRVVELTFNPTMTTWQVLSHYVVRGISTL